LSRRVPDEPRPATQTEARTDWFVHADARAGEDYGVQELTALWDITNRQDWELCELNQAGVNSRAYEPGPYNLTGEPVVVDFIARHLELTGK
jgi:Rieske 2Fe-2S family protein